MKYFSGDGSPETAVDYAAIARHDVARERAPKMTAEKLVEYIVAVAYVAGHEGESNYSDTLIDIYASELYRRIDGSAS